jgi:molybdopterin-guanine dinucleotide biosynthesis protein A
MRRPSRDGDPRPRLRKRVFGGLVLAGGRSSRMGVDKATLQYQGRTLLEHMAGLLADVGAAPIMNAGQPGGLTDPAPNCGPASGLIALANYVAANPKATSWLVVPVDMPLVTPNMLIRLVETEGALAHYEGTTLPLIIDLDPQMITRLLEMRRELGLEKGVSLWRIIKELGAVRLAVTDDEGRRLLNVNTPSDWSSLSSDA